MENKPEDLVSFIDAMSEDIDTNLTENVDVLDWLKDGHAIIVEIRDNETIYRDENGNPLEPIY